MRFGWLLIGVGLLAGCAGPGGDAPDAPTTPGPSAEAAPTAREANATHRVTEVQEGRIRMGPALGVPCPEPSLRPTCYAGVGSDGAGFSVDPTGLVRVTLEATWTPTTPGAAALRIFFRSAEGGGGVGDRATSPFRLEVPLEVATAARDALVTAAPEAPGGLTTNEEVALRLTLERVVAVTPP